MLRYIFGLLTFALALWAGTVHADTSRFVYPVATVAAHGTLPFVRDDPRPAFHIHKGSANAADRAAYRQAEARFDAVPACLTATGHPADHYDLTRVDWDALTDGKAVELCLFRLINFVGTDRIDPYLNALGFDVTTGPKIEEVTDHATGTTRIVQTFAISLQRDRGLGTKAPNQTLFRGTLFPQSATINLSTSHGDITHIQFSLNTL